MGSVEYNGFLGWCNIPQGPATMRECVFDRAVVNRLHGGSPARCPQGVGVGERSEYGVGAGLNE